MLPTFNRAKFITEAIGAVIAQMTADDELLVIDDGSTDGTPDIVAAMGERVRYVRQDNSGKSAALNLGLSMTTGAFVMICDDDDVLRADTVAALMTQLDETQADFVFGRYSRFRSDENGAPIDMGTGYWPNLSSGLLVRHILEDAFVMQNAAIVRRSAYDRVGPFDVTMLRSLDYEMFVRLALSCTSAYCDRYIFDQRKHEGVRGPAQALHAATKSDSVWRGYDQRIFTKLYDQLTLSDYAAMYVSEDPRRLQRAALLQRACIYARHDLWQIALRDLQAAADIMTQALDAGEIDICARSLNGKHGISGATDVAVVEALRALLRHSLVGGEIVRAMLDGALWRLRAGTENDAVEMRKLILSLVGRLGLVRALIRKKRNRTKRQPALLSESKTWAARADHPLLLS
ncbi:glycosyltransferase family 2 protein [Sphingomonas sp. RB3P16]|uniref:glycosyltransferase family 2 protein n=1 Tax=Parasphingomonas frigoris TaxID=3096163 RepID=UPI002FC889E7